MCAGMIVLMCVCVCVRTAVAAATHREMLRCFCLFPLVSARILGSLCDICHTEGVLPIWRVLLWFCAPGASCEGVKSDPEVSLLSVFLLYK